jgi:hypothetical protein
MTDLNDIFISEDIKETEVEYQGKKFALKIKPITWSKKNQILTKCFTYGQDGQMSFNFDKYMKEILVEIIAEAPWGKTDQIFLSRIKPDFGAILEKLVPKAFEELQSGDFFVKE